MPEHEFSNIAGNIVKINPTDPENKVIKQAGGIIAKKGVVVFPAQYFYGIAVDALNIDALQKVFDIKQRPLTNPLLALIKNRKQLEELVSSIPDMAEKIMKKFWPGNVTIIFNAAAHIPSLITASTQKIGLRMPLHPVAKALVNAVNSPVTGTSANISTRPACNTIDQLDPDIVKNTDIILDAGKLKTGLGSTVVDVTGDFLKIIRQGEITKSEILKTCQKKHKS